MGEFDLIGHIVQRIAGRVGGRNGVLLGIGDDAAVLRLDPGQELVVTTDTLNGGVHFPPETAAADIGWKALAVNLSDLAAMGAQPRWCTLSLALPQPDATWLDAFLDGFIAMADAHGIQLVGGDTTRGPLSIGITAMGSVPQGTALRRDRAQSGDDIWVTGTLGDAAMALQQWQSGSERNVALRQRLDRPQPRLAFGLALRGVATACIDVSDGLLQDLGHVTRASRVGAELWLDALPASPELQQSTTAAQRHGLQGSGGDDYELCFTAPLARRDDIAALSMESVQATRIGTVTAASDIRMLQPDGSPWQPERAGYRHFD